MIISKKILIYDIIYIHTYILYIIYMYIYIIVLKYITPWLFNIAMENGPFIDGLPIKNGDFPWLC